MSDLLNRAERLEKKARDARAAAGLFANNPAFKLLPGASTAFPVIVDSLQDAAELLADMAREIQQIKGGENG